ncbi:unnamed protein product [Ambrosiozyma monospora]|uniref:Unnamed protein product n=1 Tax=Ambrosiozyma monospora TaxID=43982 RepID=A0A9W6Z608_AMBMO|nr:unnamed protein product [Ambrosiozyma monospora]
MSSHFDNHNNEQEAPEHTSRFNNTSNPSADQKDPTPSAVASLVSESGVAVDIAESRRPSVVIPGNLNTSSLMSAYSQPAKSQLSFSQSSSTQPQLPSIPIHHHTHHLHHHTSNNSIDMDSPESPGSLNFPMQHSRSQLNAAKAARKARKSKSKISKSSIANGFPTRRFRSRSLPNIWFPSKHSSMLLNDLKYQQSNPALSQRQQELQQQQQQQVLESQQQLLLPPVNLQSLHEIDLHEVLKNPQLRHDILFDPQLQFRPNLDGERGKRKRQQAESYWSMIKSEIDLLLLSDGRKVSENSPLALLFQTLKNILLDCRCFQDALCSNERSMGG